MKSGFRTIRNSALQFFQRFGGMFVRCLVSPVSEPTPHHSEKVDLNIFKRFCYCFAEQGRTFFAGWSG